MTTIGYATGAFDLFHIGHLNLLERAKSLCDVLIAGVVSDELLQTQKGITPVVPLAERLEVVRSIRCVDEAYAAVHADKLDIWRELHFNFFFKGDDWQGTEEGLRLEREFAKVGVEVVYFPYTKSTSSTALRAALANIDRLAAISRSAPSVDRLFPRPESLSTLDGPHLRAAVSNGSMVTPLHR